ncbi:hypothetical protein MLD52_16100 [Puniceicoccaceae bacterium K14]|nr:hypothetical protein [Puniceicoccaceae bacterium K14]
MIFDAIAALFAAIVEPIVMAILCVFIGITNLFLVIIELVIGIFIHGYKTKRIQRKEWKNRSSQISGWSSLVVIVLAVVFLVIMEIKDREVQIVASDGHSLPYAEVVITTKSEVRNERTDNLGRVEIPRFGLISLSVIDPRYVEQSWAEEEIEKRLEVERTFLGSGLDKIANKLLNKDG